MQLNRPRQLPVVLLPNFVQVFTAPCAQKDKLGYHCRSGGRVMWASWLVVLVLIGGCKFRSSDIDAHQELDDAAAAEAASYINWEHSAGYFQSAAEALRLGLAVRQVLNEGMSPADWRILEAVDGLNDEQIQTKLGGLTGSSPVFHFLKSAILSQNPINPFTGKISSAHRILQWIEQFSRAEDQEEALSSDIKALEATLTRFGVDRLDELRSRPELDYAAQLYHRRMLFREWQEPRPKSQDHLPSLEEITAELESLKVAEPNQAEWLVKNGPELIRGLEGMGFSIQVRDSAQQPLTSAVLFDDNILKDFIVSHRFGREEEFLRRRYQYVSSIDNIMLLKRDLAFSWQASAWIDQFVEAFSRPVLLRCLQVEMRWDNRISPQILKRALMRSFGINPYSAFLRPIRFAIFSDHAKLAEVGRTADLPSLERVERQYMRLYDTPTPDTIRILAKKFEPQFQESWRKHYPNHRSDPVKDFHQWRWLEKLRTAFQQKTERRMNAPPDNEAIDLKVNADSDTFDLPLRFSGEQPELVRIPGQGEDVQLSSYALSGARSDYTLEYNGQPVVYSGRYLALYLPPFAVPDAVWIRSAAGVREVKQLQKNSARDSYFVDLGFEKIISYEVRYHYEAGTPVLPETISASGVERIIARLESLGETKVSSSLKQALSQGRAVSYRMLENWLRRFTIYQLAAPEDIKSEYSYEPLKKLVQRGQFRMKCDASACALALLMRETTGTTIEPIIVYDRYGRSLHAQVGVFQDGLREVYDATGTASSLKAQLQAMLTPAVKYWQSMQNRLRRLRGERKISDLAVIKEESTDRIVTHAPEKILSIEQLKKNISESGVLGGYLRDTELKQNLVLKLYRILASVGRWRDKAARDEDFVAEIAAFRLSVVPPHDVTSALRSVELYADKMGTALRAAQPSALKGHDYLSSASPATRHILAALYDQTARSVADMGSGPPPNSCERLAAQLGKI